MRRIDAAIFDVDGVILDTMPVWHDAGARFLAANGIEAEPGLGDRLFSETSITGAKYILDHYDLDMTVEEVANGISESMEQFYFEEAEFKEGALEFLMELRERGIPMTVATSTPGYCIERAFRRLGILDWFEAILSCNDLGTTKQTPFIFDRAAAIMKAEPEYSWVFEDGLYSIKTAKNAGYKIVGVYDVISLSEQEEIKALSDVYLSDLRDFWK